MARLAEGEAIPGARFVDPKVLARLGKLDLLARTVVDGFINGLHKAPFFGASMEFAEHRGYVAGDDVRRVDWRLYARTDKYFVKQYDADTNTNFSILLDVSKSMGFTSGGPSKLEYGCYLAACLAYLAHRQRDRVGIITFDEDIVDYVPVSAKHFNVLLHTLDRATPQRAGSLNGPVNKMAEHFKRRSVLALISDFYEEPDVILEAIKPLSFLGNDLMVFHILDQAEIEFNYDDASAFEDLESGEQIPVVPEALQTQYRSLVQEHIDTLTTKLSEHRIDYTMLNTSKPLDHALFTYLAMRERMRRVR